MQSLGFKVPVGLQRYGSIGSIAYEGQGVKLEGVKFIELETERASTKEESGLTSVLKTEQGGEAPKPLSKNSIAQASGESNANEAAVLKTTLKRLIEQVSSAPPNRHMRLKNFVQFSQFSSRCFGGTIEAESSDIQEEPHGRKEH